MKRCSIPVALVSALLAFVVLTGAAHAHFPFIIPAQGGATGTLVMSETLTPDKKVSVGLLSGTPLVVRESDGTTHELIVPQASDGMDTLGLAFTGSGTRTVYGTFDLGVMARAGATPHQLIYHAKGVIGDPFDPSTVLGQPVPIEFAAEVGNHCYHLRLFIDGKPAANAPMHLIHEDGRDEELTTDGDGRTPPLMPGRFGAWARHWVDAKGELDGKAFEQMRHYATYVADLPNPHGMPGGVRPGKAAPTAGGPAEGVDGVAVAPLPRPVSSFGATALDGWLYVYGGHSGTRHDYSTASVSGRLSRIRIDELSSLGAAWEELPGGPSLQGLNLVAHGGRIIRAGGMEPRNGPGEPANNHSVTDVAAYDPAVGAWTSLPALPVSRSSHDLVVVGDTLVVVGGWSMAGSRAATQWHDQALLLDLSAAAPAWQSIPQPFQRRALIAGVIGDDVFVVGGFDPKDRPRNEVDILHVPTRTWSKAPPLPIDARAGFAPAAVVFGGQLHVSVSSGELFALAADRSAWRQVASTTPRIVHRMVSDTDGAFVIGGAREAAMTDLIEYVALRDGAQPKVAVLRTSAQPKSVVARAGKAASRESWSYPDEAALGRAMDAIDEAYESIDAVRAGGWPSQGEARSRAAPDAERIVTHLKALSGAGADAPARFTELLAGSASAAQALQVALGTPGSESDDLGKAFAAVKASCSACHEQYR